MISHLTPLYVNSSRFLSLTWGCGGRGHFSARMLQLVQRRALLYLHSAVKEISSIKIGPARRNFHVSVIIPHATHMFFQSVCWLRTQLAAHSAPRCMQPCPLADLICCTEGVPVGDFKCMRLTLRLPGGGAWGTLLPALALDICLSSGTAKVCRSQSLFCIRVLVRCKS